MPIVSQFGDVQFAQVYIVPTALEKRVSKPHQTNNTARSRFYETQSVVQADNGRIQYKTETHVTFERDQKLNHMQKQPLCAEKYVHIVRPKPIHIRKSF